MAISEAQKRARNSWDKKNMVVLSCNLEMTEKPFDVMRKSKENQ